MSCILLGCEVRYDLLCTPDYLCGKLHEDRIGSYGRQRTKKSNPTVQYLNNSKDFYLILVNFVVILFLFELIISLLALSAFHKFICITGTFRLGCISIATV